MNIKGFYNGQKTLKNINRNNKNNFKNKYKKKIKLFSKDNFLLIR